ncbi:MAG: hypothetical protein Ct9H300mP21_02530 [Pseudomonadota bacterium]|nr:MAG: hypothetical protein Ct9H300mP21_02530 [Pseudomonadota bacterium]
MFGFPNLPSTKAVPSAKSKRRFAVIHGLDLHGKRMEFDKTMTLVSEYDVPEDAWFFLIILILKNAFSVLMEIALQPCGFISTHSGAILPYPELDLYYRNLDGNGTLLRNPDLRGKTF